LRDDQEQSKSYSSILAGLIKNAALSITYDYLKENTFAMKNGYILYTS